MPETAEGYAANLSEAAQKVWGADLTADPAFVEARAWAKEQGMSQGEFDRNVVGLMERLAEKGVIEPAFDPAAELAQLGENGETRRREAELFAEAWKARGELDDAEFGELMSLTPTAAGVRLVEKMRKAMANPPTLEASPAPGTDANGDTAAQAAARAARADPRYENDPAFRRQADRAWMEAFA